MRKRCTLCDRPAPLTAWCCSDCGGETALTPGSVVSGRWRIVRLVKAGAASRVYLVRGRDDRSEAILKVRPPRPILEPEPQAVLDTFPVAAVRHPNVVTSLEGGVGADGAPWLALEALRGRTLREHLGLGEVMTPPLAAEVLAQVAEGLSAIHEKGFVHGSLDAQAIFLVLGRGHGVERAVLLDFPPQSARSSPGEARPNSRGDSAMSGVAPDFRTDLFSLGAVAWECLAGRPVGSGEGRRTRRLPVPLTLLRPPPEVPTDLDDFIMRLLCRDPDRRPASAREVVDRFGRWRSGSAIEASSGRAGSRSAGDGVPARPPARVELSEPAAASRGNEMRRLSRVLDEAAGGRGAVLWLEGDEGAGKTTLGQGFLGLAAERGFRVGSGRAAPGHRLSAWREALAAVDVLPRDDVGSAPPLEALVEQAVESGPLALFLDDFHAADPSSSDLLDRVAERLADRPLALAILVASRPLGRSPAGDEAGLHRVLATIRGLGGAWRLPGMTDREIDAVTAGMSPKPFEPDLRALVRRAAAGNPMVAVQVLRHLAAEGALWVKEGRVALASERAAALPDGLRQVLAARLEGLRRTAGGTAAGEILDRVALLGRHATPTNLRALLELEGQAGLREGLSASLARLAAEGFVREVPWRPEPFLMPVHAGLREALEAERHGPDSARRHLAVARILESVAPTEIHRVAADLADHYERAGFLDLSVEWLRRAADRAVTEGDVVRSRDLLLRADGHLLALGLAADARRTEILLDLASREVFCARYREAARVLDTAARACPPAAGSPAARRLLEIQACLEEARRHPDKAVAALEQLESQARTAGDTTTLARALLRLACLRMDRGDNRGAEVAIGQAAAVPKGANDPRIGGLLDLVRGRLLRKTGPCSEAIGCVDRALAALTDPRDFAERIEALFFRAACLMDRDLHAEAIEVCRTGAALCEQAGYPRGLAGHLANLAVCLGRLGQIDDGMEAARRSLEIRERIGDSRGLAQVLTALADLAIARKEWPVVRELSERALVLCRQTGYVQGERVALLNLARSFHGLGDGAEARRRLEACLLTAHRDDSLSLVLANAHLALADLLEGTGERDAAQRHRLNAVVVFERIERPDRAEAVRRVLGAPAGSAGGPGG